MNYDLNYRDELLSALGLPCDASDSEIKQALDAAQHGVGTRARRGWNFGNMPPLTVVTVARSGKGFSAQKFDDEKP